MGIFSGQPFLKSFRKRYFYFKLGSSAKIGRLYKIKKINRIQQKNEKKKTGDPPGALNAMPFRTEARKCNHWATGGLLDLSGKFSGRYMHMK